MPEERRQIEKRLASGDLLGVVSTSALEMGIDIGISGHLPACGLSRHHHQHVADEEAG